jgi:catechol 2,3-dioxygenase
MHEGKVTPMLPDDTAMGPVRLRVANLQRALSFYHDLLALDAQQTDGTVELRAPGGAAPLIVLEESRHAAPRPPDALGLYHFALLFPDRSSLGRTLLHFFERSWPFQGFADHGVSEAAYLTDPDGNGIEFYADRPSAEWPRRDGEIEMSTYNLNVTNLLRAVDGTPWHGVPAVLRVGHVHLHVTDLAAAERFYVGVIGLDVTMRSYPGALFLAAGGYHHHLGLNVWSHGARGGEDMAGLVEYTLQVPSAAARAEIRQRAEAVGLTSDGAETAFVLSDPDGNRLRVTGGA